MSEDFLERTQSRALNYTGKALTPDEMATEFAKWDINTRVTALEELKSSYSGDGSTRQFGEHLAFSRALIGTHERLRKAGR